MNLFFDIWSFLSLAGIFVFFGLVAFVLMIIPIAGFLNRPTFQQYRHEIATRRHPVRWFLLLVFYLKHLFWVLVMAMMSAGIVMYLLGFLND